MMFSKIFLEITNSTNSISEMTLSPDFWESLAIIVIPILVGGWLTHRLSHSWQSYRYKIDIKKQLMVYFQEYVYSAHYKLELFIRQYLEKYSSNENLDELLTTGDINHTLEIPEPERFPKILLKTEYEELLKTLDESYKLRMKLISSLRLYTDSNKLIEELKIISRHNGVDYGLIKKLVKLEKFEEFDELYRKYYEGYNKSEDLIINFEKKLAELKLRKIPV